MSDPAGPPGGIPEPIVTLNRVMLLGGVAVAFLTPQPWITTLLLAILVAAVTFGPKGSIPFQVGRRFLAGRVRNAIARGEVEDRRLMRFNNSIAIVLLALAQGAFLLGAPVAGWVLSGMVALAAAVALAGFCVGCFLYYRLRLLQHRWATMRAGALPRS
ncbi:MAG: DUF4395 domain-containing protein [Thermomicrobiales bacterium]